MLKATCKYSNIHATHSISDHESRTITSLVGDPESPCHVVSLFLTAPQGLSFWRPRDPQSTHSTCHISYSCRSVQDVFDSAIHI